MCACMFVCMYVFVIMSVNEPMSAEGVFIIHTHTHTHMHRNGHCTSPGALHSRPVPCSYRHTYTYIHAHRNGHCTSPRALHRQPVLHSYIHTHTHTRTEMATLPLPERYIVSQCHALVTEVTNQLEAYTLGQAGDVVQSFLWDEFADWYLEVTLRAYVHMYVCICMCVCMHAYTRSMWCSPSCGMSSQTGTSR